MGGIYKLDGGIRKLDGWRGKGSLMGGEGRKGVQKGAERGRGGQKGRGGGASRGASKGGALQWQHEQGIHP